MPWILVASLLLQPVLDAPTPIRLVATGTGDMDVTWVLDGHTVATTSAGVAASVNLSAGSHELWVVTDHEGPWRALARPEPATAGGVVHVPAWYAEHPGMEPVPKGGWHPALPWTLGAVGLLLLAAPWRWRRPKGP